MSIRLKYARQTFRLILAFLLTKTFCRHLFNKEIWLIGEKKTEARDNAYYFFKYVRENHPEINAYFVITRDSSDLSKVERYGNIIYHNTIKHYVYFLSAKNNINSQLPHSMFPVWSSLIRRIPFLLNKKQNSVFLKHGIIYTKMSPRDLDYKESGLAIISCSAEREKNFIWKTYGYPENNIQLLGLCRFDNLHNIDSNIKRQILVMPTYRSWLVASDRTKRASTMEMQRFANSRFCQTYLCFLNNEILHQLLELYNYKMVFYPHYSFQSYIDLFKEMVINSRITIADRFHYDVQELLISSAIMITDYSSVFFDFAYMKKPEIFFQFDEEEFQEKHYLKKGYFSYKNDGFGSVVRNIDKLLKELERIMLNDAKIEDKYLKRVEEFFTVHDTNNCKRTFNAISNLK